MIIWPQKRKQQSNRWKYQRDIKNANIIILLHASLLQMHCSGLAYKVPTLEWGFQNNKMAFSVLNNCSICNANKRWVRVLCLKLNLHLCLKDFI